MAPASSARQEPTTTPHSRQAGSSRVFAHYRQDFVTEVLDFTGGEGVGVVYDGVGRDTFEGSPARLARRCMRVLFSQSSGPGPALGPLVLSRRGSLFLTRHSLARCSATRAVLLDCASQVLDRVKSGALRLRIGLQQPLSQSAAADCSCTSRNMLVPASRAG